MASRGFENLTANRDMTLDKFKERTLKRLDARKEEQRFYPIEEADLKTVNHCVLCGSASVGRLTEVYLRGELNFCTTSVCQECLYTFRAISPSYRWFKKCWAMISTKKLEVFNPEIEEIRRKRYQKYFDFLSRHVKNFTVLDVGAGYGTGSKVFRDRGCSVEALETEDDKAYYIDRYLRMPVHTTSIEEFLMNPRRYGLVMFSHCLEHLDDPAVVMSRIGDLLDPEVGILYLEVPIIWNIVTWSDALYLTHKSNFSEENLAYLAARSGLEIVEKVWWKHEEGEPWDLGLVLRSARTREEPRRDLDAIRGGHNVDEVRELYRRNLPLRRSYPTEKVLKYSVPYIDHFYYTLRLDRKKVVEPSQESDFISFASVAEA